MMVAGERSLARFQRGEHGEDAGDVFGSGAAALLLRATAEHRFETAAARAFEKADALSAAEFVGGAADEIARALAADIADRLNLPPGARTSAELHSALLSAGVDDALAADARRVLDECDRLRFSATKKGDKSNNQATEN